MTPGEYFSFLLAGMTNVCRPIENLDGTLKNTTCPCGQSNERLRIYGAEEMSPNQYPFMLLIVQIEKLTRRRKFLGGATILTERHAVTAAQCTRGLAPNADISVVAGAHDRSKLTANTMMVPVTKHLEHDGYDAKTLQNDICLLFLASPLRFGRNISPICLPTNQVSLENKDVTIIGWGMVGINQPVGRILRRVDVKILPHSECKPVWLPLYNPRPGIFNQICTGAKGKGACLGDKGGPVIYLDPEIDRYVLVGVVSFGDELCYPDHKTVESNVSYYMPWITSHIKSGYCQKI
ncbi:clotting factor G beta subunit [Halyomorpha halys]|uniref:clotting factor G beta subunit n=1 Tax=Halyomorpha halys TaxID=286706 RepID=UPI0034D2E2EC